jgi:hypothetical protein
VLPILALITVQLASYLSVPKVETVG